MEGVEDCLQLSIYTPNVDKSKPLLPVMVWFHGGHFMYGGNNIYGPDYLLQEDVVLVTVNYRLNSLGFLNTGDGVVTGNQGLKDQNLALQWIKSAIKDFGALQQSGSSLCPWAYTRDPKSQAKRLAGQLNCSAEASKSSLELVSCLRKKSAEEIASVHAEIENVFHEIDAIFGPSIEQVDDATKAKGNVPLIAGLNSEEGCFRSPPYEDRLSELNENWSQVAPKTFLLYNEDPSLSEKIRKYYFGSTAAVGKSGNEVKGSKKIGMGDLESMTNLYSDRYFTGCVKDAATFHAQYAPVYLYYFTYKQDISYGYILENTPGRIPVDFEVLFGYVKLMLLRHVLKWEVNDYGVCHSDEMQSLFNLNPLLTINEHSSRYPFSREMVKLWVSFAKAGKPNDFAGVSWDPLKFDKKTNKTSTPLQYLRLGNVPAMIDEPFTKRLNFWTDLNLPEN
ncbi:Venom carboxylesterase-6 [Orchesella cincta]|uniref:Venom carboxylesterase-6 n=1 Tax=Orchesella cincta TaxID=48709 RepID=A0A1D2N149_ORCCI|nr:Venom carboxylesterase-6 [Orchesella cincta]